MRSRNGPADVLEGDAGVVDTSLASVIKAIERLTEKPSSAPERPAISTGWVTIDRALTAPASVGGLARGVIHEWLGLAERDGEASSTDPKSGLWFPPLTVVAHLARRAVEQDRSSMRCVLWIGRRCWAYPPSLARSPAGVRVLERSLFISTRNFEDRMWAIDVALRSRAVGVLIADGSGVRMDSSRRFQLAASVGGALALLVRPEHEARELSAARTRWLVSPASAEHSAWTLELLRCKGVRPAQEGARRWIVRMNHETGDVSLVPDAPDRRAAPGRPAAGRTA